MFLRETTTGDLEGFEALVDVVGKLGVAAIGADANKYAANQVKKASVLDSLTKLKIANTEADAAVAIEKTKAETQAHTEDKGATVVLGLFGLWLLFG